MKNGKITPEEIKDELLPKCKEVYGPLWDKGYALDELYYELKFADKMDLPTEFADEGIVLPTARDMVDTFVDHIDIDNARVFVNRKGTSQASADEQEMMRKFYLGLIHRTNVESDISPWRVAAKHYALHGLAVFKTVWDADRWIDKPEQNDGESETDYADRIEEWQSQTHQSIPIVIQAINPNCIMPDPSYGGRQFVIEEQSRMCFDASRRWPHWSNPEGKKLDQPVTYISYWDEDYRCDMIDGEPILKVKGGVVKHKYGFIPYVLIDSGLGNMAADGDPLKRYVGMLRYMFDLLVAESRDFSISDIVLKKAGFPYLTISGKNAAMVTEISQKYGVANRIPFDDVKIEEVVSKVPPEALNAQLYRTSDYISAHAAPRSVRGLGEVGVRSGADRRLVLSEAAARYQYSEEAFKHGTSKVLTNCARLMKNVVPGDIRVWAKTPSDSFDIEIKKEKMREPFTCYVEFAPISEEDEYRRHDDAERLVASGIVTRQWARTQMSNIDPQAMEVEEEKEKLKNDPNIQSIVAQYVGGRLANAISQRSAAEGLSAGLPPPPMGQPMGQPQGGMPPGGVPRQMAPPVTERPPIGSAEALQNQLASLRSKKPMKPQQGIGGGGNR